MDTMVMVGNDTVVADMVEMSRDEDVLKRETAVNALVSAMIEERKTVEDFKIGPRKRPEDESFVDYRKRLKLEQTMMKVRERLGIRRWDSRVKGTYINPLRISRPSKKERKDRIKENYEII